MYLVLMVQHNRVISVKAFSDWYRATLHADKLAIQLNRGLSVQATEWENNDYRNVLEINGVALMIEPCDEPENVTKLQEVKI